MQPSPDGARRSFQVNFTGHIRSTRTVIRCQTAHLERTNRPIGDPLENIKGDHRAGYYFQGLTTSSQVVFSHSRQME